MPCALIDKWKSTFISINSIAFIWVWYFLFNTYFNYSISDGPPNKASKVHIYQNFIIEKQRVTPECRAAGPVMALKVYTTQNITSRAAVFTNSNLIINHLQCYIYFCCAPKESKFIVCAVVICFPFKNKRKFAWSSMFSQALTWKYRRVDQFV